MKVLLTNHHMIDRAGSELLVTELAEGLRDKGHDVAIFTLFPGQFGEAYQRRSSIEILSPATADRVRPFAPHVIHVTHWPTLVRLRGMGLDAPAAYAFLGVLPPLENPPPIEAGDPAVAWCVSEEVADNVSSIAGWPRADQISIVRNSITPGFETVERLEPRELTKIAIVSNHFPEHYREMLERLCPEIGCELEVIGLPDNPREIAPEDLASFDAVVSLGRTAIAAAAMGTPTLVLDSNGADGWLTPANLRQSQRHNFSGRGLGLEPDEATLREWLLAPPSPSERRSVAESIRRDHDFGSMLDQVETLLTQASEQTSPQVFGRHCKVVDDYIGRILHHQTHIEILTAERDATARHRDITLAERDQAREALAATRAELESADAACEDRIEAMRVSTSWRVTAPLRAISRIIQGCTTTGNQGGESAPERPNR